MFQVKIEYGGGLVVSYNGLNEQEEEYCHPYYGDDYVWSCECHEVNDLFGCNDGDRMYPTNNEVLLFLDSVGVLCDLGLSHCEMGGLAA